MITNCPFVYEVSRQYKSEEYFHSLEIIYYVTPIHKLNDSRPDEFSAFSSSPLFSSESSAAIEISRPSLGSDSGGAV
jgi:hypothetical protein